MFKMLLVGAAVLFTLTACVTGSGGSATSDFGRVGRAAAAASTGKTTYGEAYGQATEDDLRAQLLRLKILEQQLEIERQKKLLGAP